MYQKMTIQLYSLKQMKLQIIASKFHSCRERPWKLWKEIYPSCEWVHHNFTRPKLQKPFWWSTHTFGTLLEKIFGQHLLKYKFTRNTNCKISKLCPCKFGILVHPPTNTFYSLFCWLHVWIPIIHLHKISNCLKNIEFKMAFFQN